MATSNENQKIEPDAVVQGAVSPVGAGPTIKGKPVRQKSYVLDLRIQSPASLGYLRVEGIDTAPALVRLAKVKGLDVIAVTDFFSGAFIDRVAAARDEEGPVVLPGVALRCVVGACDDLVLTVLFPEGAGTIAVAELLTALKVPASAAGDSNYIIREPLEHVLELIERHGAIVFPSQIDKSPIRLRAIPALVEQYGFRAFDVVHGDTAQFFKAHWPKIKFQLLSFSNANALAQVGSRTSKVKMAESGFPGIRTMIQRS